MPTYLAHCPELPSMFGTYPVAVKGAGLVFVSGLHGSRPGASPATFDEAPKAGRDKLHGFALVDGIAAGSELERLVGDSIKRKR